MILSELDLIKRVNNGQKIVSPFAPYKVSETAGNKILSYGLSGAGYDVRLGDEVRVVVRDLCERPLSYDNVYTYTLSPHREKRTNRQFVVLEPHEFILGVSMERFEIPTDVIGMCTGKSTYARLGVGVYVTPLEPGWCGYLTVEIANHGSEPVAIYLREGIAQVTFHLLSSPADPYEGKYQDQKYTPVPARL